MSIIGKKLGNAKKHIYIGQVLEHNIDTGLFHTLLCTYIVLLSLYNCSMICM